MSETVNIQSATVVTMIPYTDEVEYKEYDVVSGEELATLLSELNDPQHAERVVDTQITYTSSDE